MESDDQIDGNEGEELFTMDKNDYCEGLAKNFLTRGIQIPF